MAKEPMNAKISDLIPDSKNFNKGTEYGNSLVEKSLRQFGAGRSILLDRNNNIIAGNKTVESAGSAGFENIIIVETTGQEIVAVKRMDIDLDSKQGREMALADNAAAVANINFDVEMVEAELGSIIAESWGLTPTGEKVKEDDYIPPDSVVTDIQPGDIFKIGPHTLMCGDSTSSADVKKLTEGKEFDLVITDPPYNVDYTGKTKDALKIGNDKQSDSEFYEFLLKFHKAFVEHTKPGGAWYVWHADSEGLNFRKAFINSGLMMKQCLIWVKNCMVMGRQDYQWKHEPCLYGWKPGAAHYFVEDRTKVTVIDNAIDFNKMKKDELLGFIRNMLADITKTTIVYFDKPSRSAEHQTMKPVELIADQISNSSRVGEIVGDGFGGSGTTMVACHQIGRECRMMENDPKYCWVVIDRMKKLDKTLKITKNGKEWKHAK